MPEKHIVIIGAGLGGLTAAIKLQEAGYSYTILEQGDRVGGTWAQNTYPGCACDVPVALYQLSFAQSMNWSRIYPQQPEIQAYAEEITDRFQLRPHLHLNEGAEKAVWNEDTRKWTVTSTTGDTYEADAVIGALGQLNRPFWPDIPGKDSFNGAIMHSAEWDHSVDLKGKRIAIIGSAASAIQIIPEVAKVCANVGVFQRSPNWVVPRNDRFISPEEKAMMMTQPEKAIEFAEINRRLIYENSDYFFWQAFEWTPEGRAAFTRQATDHLHNQVEDEDLRKKLTPDYPVGCRRILISDDYFTTLTKPHVDLITDGIDAIVPEGIRTKDGAVHEYDVIAFATGFETTGWRWSVDVIGRDGVSITDKWQDGPEAYLGITVADYPNLFILYGPNTNLGHNSITFMLERQVEYTIQALQKLDETGAAAMSPRQEIQDAFNKGLQKQLGKTVWADPACNSWYKTGSGKITQNWASHTRAYADIVAEVKLEDYDLV
ncbi:MAG: NAD(P)/FAD-dependent oxidoreductase [Alphaproteobacteria bacterium]|nr:4-hydroxyacetophenone monooxygenase [Hyphomonas sp.]MBR9808773.1 NAD(P)/FAD-dependent oxidoreductase [Alphaproteobacteria bacterium]|tara:strand:+ start:500 stop:1966 length:1467 start_codon:yes stop_codon:yes gene_type:complete